MDMLDDVLAIALGKQTDNEVRRIWGPQMAYDVQLFRKTGRFRELRAVQAAEARKLKAG